MRTRRFLYQLIVLVFIGLSSLQAQALSCRSLFSDPLFSQSDVLKIINSSEVHFSKKVEIGGGADPICSNCIQVDVVRDLVDSVMRGNPSLKSRAQVRETLMKNPDVRAEFDIDAPWAAGGSRGVIADGRSLPFKNSSLQLVVKKNFPWFQAQGREIRSFLQEYYRVLSPKGVAIFLFHGSESPQVKMKTHVQEAKKLGFRVDFTQGPDVSGLLLQKN